MKRKITIILLAVCAVVVIATAGFFVAFSPNRGGEVVFQNDLVLPEGKAIEARGRTGVLGILKGDVFPYYIEIWYDPGQVAEIDKANLEKSVNLAPFDIRNVEEKVVNLDQKTRLYQKEYTLQLVTGNAGQLYEIPEIAIRYKPNGSDGLLTTSITPEPIYVASRLTGEVRDLAYGYGPLRPIAGKIQATNPSLPWVFWGLGGVMAVFGVVTFTRRGTRQRSEGIKNRRQPEQCGIVFEAYRSLLHNLAIGAKPRELLHQMEDIVRVVLAQKEKVDWLAELDCEKLPPDICEQTASLLEICHRAYQSDDLELLNVEDGLRRLDEILGFYYGIEELGTWRDSPSL